MQLQHILRQFPIPSLNVEEEQLSFGLYPGEYEQFHEKLDALLLAGDIPQMAQLYLDTRKAELNRAWESLSDDSSFDDEIEINRGLTALAEYVLKADKGKVSFFRFLLNARVKAPSKVSIIKLCPSRHQILRQFIMDPAGLTEHELTVVQFLDDLCAERFDKIKSVGLPMLPDDVWISTVVRTCMLDQLEMRDYFLSHMPKDRLGYFSFQDMRARDYRRIVELMPDDGKFYFIQAMLTHVAHCKYAKQRALILDGLGTKDRRRTTSARTSAVVPLIMNRWFMNNADKYRYPEHGYIFLEWLKHLRRKSKGRMPHLDETIKVFEEKRAVEDFEHDSEDDFEYDIE